MSETSLDVYHARVRQFTTGLKSRLSGVRARRAVTIIVGCLWLAGIVARVEYGVVEHNPRHYIVSDARQLTDTAERMLAAPSAQEIYDTVWPPGTPAVLATLLARDGSLGTAAWLQVLLSCLVPLLVAHTAFLIGGRGMGLIALGLSSLHFGFVLYTGIFLSETFFQFAMALAIWIGVAVLVVDERLVSQRPNGLRTVAARLGLGTAVGLCWALATSFRPNALPIAFGIGLALAAYWMWQRKAASLWLLVGGLLGILALLSPMAHRCTELKGNGFCTVSTNFAMNVALGQLDHSAGIEFFDPRNPYLNTGWWPPALAQHGYTGTLRFPFTMYDNREIWHWVRQQVWRHPGAAIIRAGRNVADLFGFSYWPEIPPLKEWFLGVTTAFVFTLVILPGFWGLWRIGGWIRRGGRGSAIPVLLFSSVVGVVVVAVMALGEPRYRFPFDAIFIVLGGMVFCGVAPGDPPNPVVRSLRALPWAVGAVAVFALGVGLLVAMVSSPGIGLARRFQPAQEVALSDVPPDVHEAGQFSWPFPEHTNWNAPGVYRFECGTDCREVRLQFVPIQHSRRIELSVDNNDRYRVVAYRAGVPLGHSDVPRTYDGPGLRVAVIELPVAAAAGFDSVGVFPLYGDGVYVLGHLRVIP